MPKFRPDKTLREMQWLLPSGPYYVRKRIKNPDHPAKWDYKCKSTGFKNSRLARKKAMEILASWNVAVPGIKIETFREAKESYKTCRERRERSIVSIETALKHLSPYFDPMKVDAITENHAQDYFAKRRAERLGVALHNEWKALTGIMNLMHRQGHRRLKFQVPDPDRDRDLKDIVFSDPELAALFAAANPTTRLQFAMATDLFMRRWEILGLSWDRIDFEIRETGSGKVYGKITLPKSVTKIKEFREFPMTEAIHSALRLRWKVQQKRFLRQYGETSPFVFPSRGTPKVHSRSLKTAFKAAKRRGQVVSKGTFHTFRHTGLTRAFGRVKSNAGMAGTRDIPPSAVKICLMAGLSIQTAMDRYLHIKVEDLGDVIGVSMDLGAGYLGANSVTANVGKCGKSLDARQEY